MQEIARAAGVNQALLHYYFRSKDRLAEAVFRRAARQLLPSVIAVLASEADLEEKVTQVVQLELDHLLRTPGLPGYVIGELSHHPDRARQFVSALTGVTPEDVRPRVFRTLRAQIEERVRRGRMRRIAPEQLVVNLLCLCIFPFAARPMLEVMLGLDDRRFVRFVARRRKELAPFFLRALRP